MFQAHQPRRRGAFVGRSRLGGAVGGLAILSLLAVFPLAARAAGSRTVTLGAASYSPMILTVEVGTKIVFDNTSQFPHTATADNAAFDTGMIAAGTSKSIIATAPGVYPFFCQFHGGAGGVGQAGTLTVVAAASATNPPGGGAVTSPTARPGNGDLPSTAAISDLPGFEELTGIALAVGVVLAVVMAFVIDAVRSRRRTSGG